ncbi:MAG: sigma-70 family RNA polymerase sigma factor [Microbacterium sp.]
MEDGFAQDDAPIVDLFAQFYARHYHAILTVAQQRLAGIADAEDAAAETFRITWAHHLDGGELSLAWAYRVLRNVIGNEYQRAARADRLYERVGRLSGDAAFQLDSDDALDVRRCVNDLREEDRDIIYMAYWEDLSRTEIAAILGVSPVGVRVKLLRARRALRALLDDTGEQARKETNDGRA